MFSSQNSCEIAHLKELTELNKKKKKVCLKSDWKYFLFSESKFGGRELRGAELSSKGEEK